MRAAPRGHVYMTDNSVVGGAERLALCADSLLA
jgi:hypothetical protein